jgi:EpsI family protein
MPIQAKSKQKLLHMRLTKYNALAIIIGLLLGSALLLVEARENQSAKVSQPDLQRLVNVHPDGWTPIETNFVDPRWKESMKGDYDLVAAQGFQRGDGKNVVVVMTWSRDGVRRAGHSQQMCYQAGGATVTPPEYATVATKAGKQDMITFTANHGNQIEDVMYWRITGGKTDISTGQSRLVALRFDRLNRLAQHILGDMPDNLMVRVSSQRSAPDQPATAQIDFIKGFIETVSPSDRKLVIGTK